MSRNRSHPGPLPVEEGRQRLKEVHMKRYRCLASVLGVIVMCTPLTGLGATWEPQKPIEFIIPAGPGGGADVMARFIAPLVSKYNLSPQPLVAVNKSGGAGAEGFLYVRDKKGDPHVMIITLSNLFTTPLLTRAPFNWKDFTPLARLALDEFILWVNSESPYTTAVAYLQAAKENPGKFKMGGTGTAQEDQIITVQLERRQAPSSSTSPSKGAAMSPPIWWASMWTRRSIIPTRRWATGKPGGSARWGSSMRNASTCQIGKASRP